MNRNQPHVSRRRPPLRGFPVARLAVSALLGGLALAPAYAGEARSVAVATHGGVATSTATAIGNSRAESYSAATRGGRSDSNATAVGTGDGFAGARSVASADRGRALSNANADATGLHGGSAIADSESIATTIGGVAVSDSDALAEGTYFGTAVSRSNSVATSAHGVSRSGSRAASRGYTGGHAVSDGTAVADTIGGFADSDVEAVSDAGFFGRAHSESRDVAVTVGPQMYGGANGYAGDFRGGGFSSHRAPVALYAPTRAMHQVRDPYNRPVNGVARNRIHSSFNGSRPVVRSWR